MKWERIDHVLLDMDGTLLDLRFDTEFWLEHLPGRYAETNDLHRDEALARIRERMEALSGQLGWYCIDEWSDALGLDIAALKREYAEGIRYRETSVAFLEALAQTDKHALIVTNAAASTVTRRSGSAVPGTIPSGSARSQVRSKSPLPSWVCQ